MTELQVIGLDKKTSHLWQRVFSEVSGQSDLRPLFPQQATFERRCLLQCASSRFLKAAFRTRQKVRFSVSTESGLSRCSPRFFISAAITTGIW